MNESRIYIELDPELDLFMIENGIIIEDLLKDQQVANLLDQESVTAKVTHEVMPTESPEQTAQSKELVSAIVLVGATTALVGTIGFAVSQAFKTIYSRPVIDSWYEYEPILDGKGKVVKDGNGNPCLKRVKKHVMLEPQLGNQQSAFEVSVDVEAQSFNLSLKV